MENPSLSISPALLSFLKKQDAVREVAVPKDTMICHSGQECNSLVIILEGQVKVFRPALNGHSITLYYVNESESCILTASCILNTMPFPAFAQSVTDVRGLAIPPEKVREWLSHEPLWQEYIFGLLAQRMASLIDLVNALAFQGLDERLASWILEQLPPVLDDPNAANQQSIIHTTHQSIAEELASSREVISRRLKEFEQQGWIALGRGFIQLIDRDSLKGLIDH